MLPSFPASHLVINTFGGRFLTPGRPPPLVGKARSLDQRRKPSLALAPGRQLCGGGSVMTMRARFFAKGDRRWLCAPWSRSMFFHLMKYGGEPPPPQLAALALPRCAAARAGLGCRRVATNHAKAKPENLRDGQRPPWNLFKAR